MPSALSARALDWRQRAPRPGRNGLPDGEVRHQKSSRSTPGPRRCRQYQMLAAAEVPWGRWRGPPHARGTGRRGAANWQPPKRLGRPRVG